MTEKNVFVSAEGGLSKVWLWMRVAQAEDDCIAYDKRSLRLLWLIWMKFEFSDCGLGQLWLSVA